MKDLFSSQSKSYAAFRPSYPQALYDSIYRHVNDFDLAWDAGTGNGQAAMALAAKFKKVLATDISAQQLENAHREPNIEYKTGGETVDLPDHSADLITVAQAIHWFDRPKFYKEVKRVAKPKSIIAVWGYGLLSVNPSMNKHLAHFYKDIIGPFWDPERKLIDDRYQSMDFPFEEIETHALTFTHEWSLDELAGYLRTWSAVKNFIDKNGTDPVTPLETHWRQVWGVGKKKISFPLFIRMGVAGGK